MPAMVAQLLPATQGALAALGGREGVVNVAPSLISLAGAVVNVAPGKACKSVKIDPDLIKVRRVHVPEQIMPQGFVMAVQRSHLNRRLDVIMSSGVAFVFRTPQRSLQHTSVCTSSLQLKVDRFACTLCT